MSSLLEVPPGSAPPSVLVMEDVTTAEALESLRDEWTALWERAADATPFQHPAWLLAWWRHLGGGELWAMAMRDAGRLVGLAPFFVYTHPDGTRQVTLLGNGVSDRLGLLAEAGRECEIAAAALAHLWDARDRWDTCDFRDLPAGSPLIDATFPGDVDDEVTDDEPAPALSLPDSMDALEEAVPAKLLKKLRYYHRRAEKEGEVCFDAVDEGTFGEAFDALVRLHAARWAERGRPGVLDDERVRAFHREAASAFLARGMLRMYTLRIGGRLAAVHYGFTAKGRAYYYLGGFDPALDAFSPGSLIVLHAIEEAVREGASVFDFLRGREAYKYTWGATDRPGLRRQIAQRSGGAA